MLLLLACTRLPDELSRPNHVALAADGTVFVSDFQHDRIVEFADDGSFRRAFGSAGIGPGQLWRITALAATRAGALLVVNRRPVTVDKDSSASRFELVRYEDGRETARVTLPVDPDGWVDAIAESADGTLVLADATTGALTELSADGLEVRGPFGPVQPDRAPSALTVDGDTVWVTEEHEHRVVQIDRAHEVRRLQWGTSEGPRFPSAAAPCPNGYLVVADYGRHRVLRYDVRGRLAHSFSPAPESPDQPVQIMDLRADPSCDRLYVVDSKGDRVLVTDLNGVVLDELWSW